MNSNKTFYLIHCIMWGIFILILLFIFDSCAYIKPNPRPWTPQEKAGAAFFIAGHSADWYTTGRHQDYPECFHEINPALGKHPNKTEIAGYFCATGLLAVGIAHFWPWTRKYLTSYGSAGISFSAHNHRLIKGR